MAKNGIKNIKNDLRMVMVVRMSKNAVRMGSHRAKLLIINILYGNTCKFYLLNGIYAPPNSYLRKVERIILVIEF